MIETLGAIVLVLVAIAVGLGLIVKYIAPGLPKAIDTASCLGSKWLGGQLEDRDQDCFLDACDPCLGGNSKDDKNRDDIPDDCQPPKRPFFALWWRAGPSDCKAVGGKWLKSKQCKLTGYDAMAYYAWDKDDWRTTCPGQLQKTRGIPVQI